MATAPTREEIIQELGPLAALAGTWEGSKGEDVAPSDDRGTEENAFNERLTFEPFGPVNNHEQTLWGLRYQTTAWRKGEKDPFHEETGYWLWDPKEKQVLRSFMIPRGVTVLAGGTVEPKAKEFQLAADAGSDTYGICSNKFLDREFKTVRYELKVTIHGDDEFSYEEDTQLKMKGRKDLFHHTDRNRLKRVKA
ncbi:MAG: FABP family protein [Bdellovibrionales bacterium]|nr:FABP family protein [Bdellovibrionales bacterium]